MTIQEWRKSSYSHQDGDCVEVRGNLRQLRDSKNPDGPVLQISTAGFIAFAETLKLDE